MIIAAYFGILIPSIMIIFLLSRLHSSYKFAVESNWQSYSKAKFIVDLILYGLLAITGILYVISSVIGAIK